MMGIGSTSLLIGQTPGTSTNFLYHQQNVCIYNNYVKGTQHYQYKEVGKHLAPNTKLRLQREANPYDAFAIEVFWDEHKLGYIPAYENIVLANMLDQGVETTSTVHHVNPKHLYNGLSIKVFTQLLVPINKLDLQKLTDNEAAEIEDWYRKPWV